MKGKFIFIFIILSTLIVNGEILERGAIKEYRGKEKKTSLPGVELMVKGAQSTISDQDGNFVLRFTTLKAGDKVNYTDIYKPGFVIFNKDALDAWRISSNGRPFTIVMCKENDFRALKKKFYGIIEKSYYEEYLRQKELAASTAITSQQLENKLRDVENEYKEKMSNINTYVELFSRIDRNEMSAIEARALEFMENGQIAEAIKAYEELQLRNEMEIQFSKWDAADEMKRAANGMESEAQADLIALIDKMQKQISLYQMGGYEYDVKRYEMMGNLISLLYRLRPFSGNSYNEMLGKLIVKRANGIKSSDRVSAFREAASLPSVAGLRALARRYQVMPPTENLIDSIRCFYHKALDLLTPDNDSLRSDLLADLKQIPEGYYHHSDGNSYPYGLLSDSTAILMGQGPWFATHLEGNIELPSFIDVAGKLYTVTGISDFAFGRNKKLYQVKLPQHCRQIGVDAFKGCDSLTIIINPELENIQTTKLSETLPKNSRIIIPETPKNISWINDMIVNLDSTATPHNIRELIKAHAKYSEDNGDYDTALSDYGWLIELYVQDKNVSEAKNIATAVSKINNPLGNYFSSYIYDLEKDYKNALKYAIKGQSDNYPYTYNRVAYVLTDPKYGKSDFPKAHKIIDKAIHLAQNDFDKANFIDTKGELYLIEGQEDKAKACLDSALTVDPDYNSHGMSKLYVYFHPDAQISASQKAEIEKMQQQEFNRLQRIRNISIALMARDFLYPRFNDLPDSCKDFIDDMVTNISVLPNDSNDFRLDALNLFYLFLQDIASKAFTYCTNNKIPFNNEWVGLIDIDSSANLDSDTKWLIFSCMAAHQMAKRLPTAGLLNEDVDHIYKIQKGIEHYLNSHTGIDGKVIQALVEGSDVSSIKESFGYDCDKISVLVNDLITSVNEFYSNATIHDLGDVPYSRDLSISHIDNILLKADSLEIQQSALLKSYIDLVARVAKVVHRELPQWENFNLTDYEELVSIGILAVEVLIRNKTPEQLAKYNELYVATAVMWAMINELQIRYQWLDMLDIFSASQGLLNSCDYELIKRYNASGIDFQKGMVRIACFMVLAKVGRSYDQALENPLDFIVEKDHNQKIPEIQKMWQIIKGCRDSIPEKYRECYDSFFCPDADYPSFIYKFPPEIVQGMLNEITMILKQNSIKWQLNIN